MSSLFFSAIFEQKGHEARWTRRVKLSRTLGKDYQVHRQLSKKSCRSRGSRSSSALCASVRALLLHKRERSLLVIGNSHKDMSVSRLSKLERSLHDRESSLPQNKLYRCRSSKRERRELSSYQTPSGASGERSFESCFESCFVMHRSKPSRPLSETHRQFSQKRQFGVDAQSVSAESSLPTRRQAAQSGERCFIRAVDNFLKKDILVSRLERQRLSALAPQAPAPRKRRMFLKTECFFVMHRSRHPIRYQSRRHNFKKRTCRVSRLKRQRESALPSMGQRQCHASDDCF